MNKTYEDYEKEYYKIISGAAPGMYVPKKEHWIASKWSRETGFYLGEKDTTIEQLSALYKRDHRLYTAVTKGIAQIAQMFEDDK